MKRKITKAIFPVAGQGTRFLPATKSIPKEIMTLVDRPLVQYAIDEARAAGIKEFIFVTSRGKGALEDYFDEAPELERSLRKKGKADLLSELKSTNMESDAVWCARRLIGDEPFAVLLPDDVISAQKPCLQQMVEAYEETGGSMVAAMQVSSKNASSYGMLDIEKEQGPLISVKGMVEKPPLGQEPSNLAVIGRYILTPSVIQNLTKIKRGAGDEIQLTDAIAQEIDQGRDVYGYQFSGQRFDCGSKAGFLQATVAFGLERDDLHDEFSEFLTDLKISQSAARALKLGA
jgi:UTP--glucose-1-phosphate uridylyltransferase